jgi:hypothetical protein
MEHANGNRCPEGGKKVRIPEVNIIQKKLYYYIKGKNKGWRKLGNNRVRKDRESGNGEANKVNSLK